MSRHFVNSDMFGRSRELLDVNGGFQEAKFPGKKLAEKCFGFLILPHPKFSVHGNSLGKIMVVDVQETAISIKPENGNAVVSVAPDDGLVSAAQQPRVKIVGRVAL